LQNARGRLAAVSSGRASLRTTEAEGKYRVEIEVPLTRAAPGEGAS